MWNFVRKFTEYLSFSFQRKWNENVFLTWQQQKKTFCNNKNISDNCWNAKWCKWQIFFVCFWIRVSLCFYLNILNNIFKKFQFFKIVLLLDVKFNHVGWVSHVKRPTHWVIKGLLAMAVLELKKVIQCNKQNGLS